MVTSSTRSVDTVLIRASMHVVAEKALHFKHAGEQLAWDPDMR